MNSYESVPSLTLGNIVIVRNMFGGRFREFLFMSFGNLN